MEKENLIDKKTKEFDGLSEKEKTIFAKQLIRKTKKILNQTNNFSLKKSYNHEFTVDGSEYKAVYERSKNFTAIFLKKILLRDNNMPEAFRGEGLSIKIDETFDKGGPSKGFPNVSFHFSDKNLTPSYNSQETIDKINSFLEDFARKAN